MPIGSRAISTFPTMFWSPGTQTHSFVPWRSTVRFPWRSISATIASAVTPDGPASMARRIFSFLISSVRRCSSRLACLVVGSDKAAPSELMPHSPGANIAATPMNLRRVKGPVSTGGLTAMFSFLMRLLSSSLFWKRCIFEEVGHAWSCVALHIPRAEIPQRVVIACGRLPANDTAEAVPELLFHRQARELLENWAKLALRNQLQSRPNHVHEDS